MGESLSVNLGFVNLTFSNTAFEDAKLFNEEESCILRSWN